MAVAAVALGFSSATQDIVVDAYRIEAAEKSLQALLASAYVAGYRAGMLVAGAVALYLAAGFGSSAGNYVYQAWKWTYLCMAGAMLVGVATTLAIQEPVRRELSSYFHGASDYARFLLLFALIAAMFIAAFLALTARPKRPALGCPGMAGMPPSPDSSPRPCAWGWLWGWPWPGRGCAFPPGWCAGRWRGTPTSPRWQISSPAMAAPPS